MSPHTMDLDKNWYNWLSDKQLLIRPTILNPPQSGSVIEETFMGLRAIWEDLRVFGTVFDDMGGLRNIFEDFEGLLRILKDFERFL